MVIYVKQTDIAPFMAQVRILNLRQHCAVIAPMLRLIAANAAPMLRRTCPTIPP